MPAIVLPAVLQFLTRLIRVSDCGDSQVPQVLAGRKAFQIHRPGIPKLHQQQNLNHATGASRVRLHGDPLDQVLVCP